MAAVVARADALPHGHEWRKRDILLVDEKKREHGNGHLKSRLRALVGFWEEFTSRENSKNSGTSRTKERSITRDIWRPHRSVALDVNAPPTYEDALWDVPPDYTATDACANAIDLREGEARIEHGWINGQTKEESRQVYEVVDVKVDFSAAENIRSRANKKAKKAAKAAAMNRWGDNSDDGEKKDEDGADGGDAGGGDDAPAGGDGGGDPPGDGGDGGDDGDDWFGGGGKKKKDKKKKKNAWEEFEEEEKKKQEEEAKAAEENGTAEAEAEPIEDWGSFAAVGKKGKKKKGKEIEPEPEPEPVVEVPAPVE
ncbi:hypothetical protein TI39_contig77g00001, partial [Zymoseptoria brevis]